MTWVQIGNFYVNLNSISRIQRISANSFTVFFFDTSISGLTLAQISPVLDALGLNP